MHKNILLKLFVDIVLKLCIIICKIIRIGSLNMSNKDKMEKLGGFTIFSNTEKKHRILASVSPSGRIAVTEAATRQFGLEKFKFALQMFDADRHVIGLQFFTEKSRDNLVRIQGRKNSGIFILGKNFLLSFGALPDAPKFYNFEKSTEFENLWTIDLTKPVRRGK